MITREKIMETANYVSPIFGRIGGYVNTDGKWSECNTTEKFKAYLESLGFLVIKCYSTSYSSAIAETADGYRIAYNGNCVMIK